MPILGVGLGIIIGVIVFKLLLSATDQAFRGRPFWISAIGFGVYWLSKTIINNMLALKLPVWITNCSSCNERVVVGALEKKNAGGHECADTSWRYEILL
jgi:hypothetical protein